MALPESTNVDIKIMDNALQATGRHWVELVKNGDPNSERKDAALDSFVLTAIKYLREDGENAAHRRDVIQQAIASIESYSSRWDENKPKMIQDFYQRLAFRLLDDQYGNSENPPVIDVTTESRKKISGEVGRIIDIQG